MRRAPIAALAGLTVAVLLTAGSCTSDDNGIEVSEARRATVTEIVDAPASVVARAAATLSAAADGTLVALRVQPGGAVRTGQVLAVIDSPAARSRLAQAEQALAAAGRSASLRLGRGADLSGLQAATDAAAQSAFAAARQAAGKIVEPTLREALLAQVAAAERHYTEAARAARRAVQGVQRGIAAVGTAVGALGAAQRLQAQQAYDLAKSTVNALTLRAPIAGVIQVGGVAGRDASSLTDLLSAAGGVGALGGAVPGAAAGGATATGGGQPPAGVSDAPVVGMPLSAGTPVLTVVDTSELGLVAEVDETDVLLVAAGVSAAVELDAAPGARYDAAVRSVDVLPMASARGGVTYRVRLSLGAGRLPDGRIAPTPRPGMSAVVHLQVNQAAEAVAVPAAAVFTVDGQDSVWVVRDGKAQRRAVTVGVPGQDLVQIVSGVRAGDRVVIRGTDQVRPGQVVP